MQAFRPERGCGGNVSMSDTHDLLQDCDTGCFWESQHVCQGYSVLISFEENGHIFSNTHLQLLFETELKFQT